jgi:predicted kinase
MNFDYETFYALVKASPQWQTLVSTVEDSQWHREANVAVHTEMCLAFYDENFTFQRTERQRLMTCVALTFHDFGKPEAEEVVGRDDGTHYRRYAGHEPVSANEFISFVCSNTAVRDMLLAVLTWEDIRAIKVMIEHHLPYGLKNETKRRDLRTMLQYTLGDEGMVAFYDMLMSDCNGRISDDHETKRQNVWTWIHDFHKVQHDHRPTINVGPVMYVMVGPVGVGKTTYVEKLRETWPDLIVVSEDDYRMQFAIDHFNDIDSAEWPRMDAKTQYATAWQFCFDHAKEYDKYARAQLEAAVKTGRTVVIDRTNQTKKSRGMWISAGKQHRYIIRSVEFFISEGAMHARQKSRPDKDVPYHRAHMIYTAITTPMYPTEVDDFEVVFSGC